MPLPLSVGKEPMTSLPQSLLTELLEELSSFERRVEALTAYTPNGLPARECLGFVAPDPLRFMFNLGRTVASGNLDEAIYEAFHDATVGRDLVGRKQVIYFPDIAVDEMD